MTVHSINRFGPKKPVLTSFLQSGCRLPQIWKVGNQNLAEKPDQTGLLNTSEVNDGLHYNHEKQEGKLGKA